MIVNHEICLNVGYMRIIDMANAYQRRDEIIVLKVPLLPERSKLRHQ